MKKISISRYLTIVFSIIMILTIVGFIIKKQYDCIYNLLAIYLGYLFCIYFEHKNKFKIKNYIKALVIITAVLHNVFGEYFHLYQTSKWFDKGLHLFGTLSISLFCYSMIRSSIGLFLKSKILIFMFIMSIGITVGVLFEHLEFITDVIFKSKTQNGLVDTNLDLILNTCGATLAGILGAFKKIPL